MKIALISPKGLLAKDKQLAGFWEKSLEEYGFRRSLTGFSSGLLVVATLTPRSCKLEFIDENFDKVDFSKDYNLVAITCMTQQATRAYEIADRFRRKSVKVVIGGIHASVAPDEAKAHADSVVIGEAEGVWGDVLKDLKKSGLKPFYKSVRPVDMTRVPLPRYDLVNSNHYKIVWIQTTRGCPIDCEFCSASKIFGLQLRHKTINQVIKEIELVRRIWTCPQISFADDNMLMDRKYARELAEALAPLNIRWFAQSDISVAEDEDFLALLHKSGCSILFIGFESVNKESMRSTDKYGFKHRRVESYKESVNKIQRNGIGVMGAFMVGFDGDDSSIFKKTADFIVDNCLYAAQITVLTPLPGTRLRERLAGEGRLLPRSWDSYTFLDVNFMPRKMSPEELQGGLFDIYKRVYSKDAAIKRSKFFKKVFKEQRSHELV